MWTAPHPSPALLIDAIVAPHERAWLIDCALVGGFDPVSASVGAAIKAPQGWLEVVPGTNAFELKFYSNGAYEWVGTNGAYRATGNPVETWHFTNSGSGQITLTHTKDGTQRVYTVSTNAGGGEVISVGNEIDTAPSWQSQLSLSGALAGFQSRLFAYQR